MNLETNFKDDKLIWTQKTLPNKITEDEDIILVVREDLIIIGFKLAFYFILFLLLFILKFFIDGFQNTTVSLAYGTGMYFVLAVLIVSFAYTFHNYYLSLQIVTTNRLIDIDQTSLFNREVNEISIEKIEDVTYKQKDIFSTVFGYGTVSVQTAASVSEIDKKGQTTGFVFENVPKPSVIHGIISNLYRENEQRKMQETATINAHQISEQIQSINNNQGNNFKSKLEQLKNKY